MPFPIPSHIQTLKPYVAGKPIEETEREYGISGAIKLASNENPLGPSPLALRALSEKLGQLHLYPDSSSYYLRRKLAAKLNVRGDEIVLGNGSNEIIELLVRTFMVAGDEAIITRGSFAMYPIAIHAHDRKAVVVPDKNHFYDLEAIAQAINERTRLVFLANPDNPAGTWFDRKPFEAFMKEAVRKNPNALIVLDEAYIEYVTSPEYPDSLQYRAQYPNLVTLRTFSKIYGLAGLRLGYGILDASLATYLERTRLPFNLNSAVQFAAEAALDDVDHVRRSLEVNREGMALLTRELPRFGIEQLPSQTNFIFCDFKRPAAPINEALLRKGVIVRPMAGYGFPNALRITIGTPEENRKLLQALGEVLG